MIGSLKKILSAENSEVKEDILKNIFAILEENAPRQNHSLSKYGGIIYEVDITIVALPETTES